MMFLYLCETCGHWQNVSLGAAIVQSWNSVVAERFRAPTHEDEGVLCPEGHGPMRHIFPDERLFRRSSVSAHDTQPLTSYQAVDDTASHEVY